MYAKWKNDDVIIKGETVIKKGEFRKIQAKSGELYMLEGRSGPKSSFGWIKEKDIVLIELDDNESIFN